VNTESHTASQTGQAAQTRRVYVKVGVVMLLLAIAGFATLAKNSQYLSRSNPAHYINISSKMKVSHLPVVIDRTPLRPVARFIPPQPEMQIARVVEEGIPALPSIGVTVSLQHRSPPLSLS
jgi:thioredoxin-like negative regulator of GroEL